MATLNLGIVAHVDAGKTSLTERLLFQSGATQDLGSVDSGTTQTDSMDLERQRGITIKAAVTSLSLGDTTVNLVDTPGHSDFIAEVERSLSILDAAVLVLSSVEGVQPQTVVIWRVLQRIGVPVVIFINKVDRGGADTARVMTEVKERLAAWPVVLTSVSNEGTGDADVARIPYDAESVVEAVAERDDAILHRWVHDASVPADVVAESVRRAVLACRLSPVVFGSAVTGVGVDTLMTTIAELVPSEPEDTEALSATVFAVDRDDRGRRAWVRLWAGELSVRQRLESPSRGVMRVTEILTSTPGGLVVAPSACAGEIAAVRGLVKARIGDAIGDPPQRVMPQFPPATLQAVVHARDPSQRGELYAALSEMADEDPLIDLRLDEAESGAVVRIHGEVQREVLASVLADRFNVLVDFQALSVVCIERVAGVGEAVEQLGVNDNPYFATIGLRVEPNEIGKGITFSSGVERGRLPLAFIGATEESVLGALEQGVYGWAINDLHVTLTDSAYLPRQSHAHQKFNKAMSSVAGDFRGLAPVVLMQALRRAGSLVCEPVERMELEVPGRQIEVMIALLSRVGAQIQQTTEAGKYVGLEADLASRQVPDLARVLPDVSGGEAVLTTRLHHYAPVPDTDPIPTRRRTGIDPADRTLWFREVSR